jgi:Ca2+/Na+ antiporter
MSQKIAGVVAAALTSLPDLITAVVYGLESDVAQSETLGCIMHDFAENMATASIVAGLFGKEIVDANPVLTSMVVALTMVSLVAALSDGDIDRYDGYTVDRHFHSAGCCSYVAVNRLIAWKNLYSLLQHLMKGE